MKGFVKFSSRNSSVCDNWKPRGRKLEEQVAQEGEANAGEVNEFAEQVGRGGFEEASDLLQRSLTQQRDRDPSQTRDGELGVGGALRFANQEVRERIRELILREVEADRDGPVPPEYRSAVDNYFRRVVEMAE